MYVYTYIKKFEKSIPFFPKIYIKLLLNPYKIRKLLGDIKGMFWGF